MQQFSEKVYHDQEEPICSCLDSAYERQALADGYKFYPKFYENKIWLRITLKRNLDADTKRNSSSSSS